MKTFKIIGKLIESTHKYTSASGNPSFTVLYFDGAGLPHKATTARDAADAYGIKNPELYTAGGAEIIGHTTSRGAEIIDYIRAVKK